MKITTTALKGLVMIEPDVHADHRGFFMESYHAAKLAALGISISFVQDNHSLSEEVGVLRGLHYQLNPHAQTKLVRVIAGAIYDVAVDIRPSSPTFGKWVGVTLSAANKQQLLVPQGFAHGFCTLEPRTQVQYKVDSYYSPAHDRGILWSDPAIGITWPTSSPILSVKDEKHPLLQDAEVNF
ncbi:dTDP-4-dehydrorhamnose 3,5-epimerase [Paenibacillus pectinilyticus]|uniref:dTDP-4-dehydrorhamnose 3,5-epimerase n=1 Tax=Paenibacillus pectinilyticus TaxID=512399 RepID=A0A1C0ZSR6_9BACL|nr:dTDP-4-dehydrorhamnose 3,5-epimerase [Paenibacillus pectinilyticus]OCT11118.1 dTDP-4-dehydrorhamnose 3,5-epimerase [Paenibacillus pectinilyticus]